MNKKQAESTYKQAKTRARLYNEEQHCVMALQYFGSGKSTAEFCVAAGISISMYTTWRNRYPMFKECCNIGILHGYAAWIQEGEDNKDDPDFNFKWWEAKGNRNYTFMKPNRVYIEVDGSANPYEQYQLLLKQSAEGAFTTAEIKQLMESINVGIRAFEAFKLQAEVDKMKEDLIKMSQQDGYNTRAIVNVA